MAHDHDPLGDTHTSGPFTQVSLLAGANTTDAERGPSVTDDGLFLYAVAKSTHYGISVATRSNKQSSFSALALVTELNTTSDEEPYVLPDHSAIYFGSDRAGTWDLYRAARKGSSFDAPVLVAGVDLATPSLEANVVVTPDELTLYFGSDRLGGTGTRQIFMATRSSKVVGFGRSVHLALVDLRRQLRPLLRHPRHERRLRDLHGDPGPMNPGTSRTIAGVNVDDLAPPNSRVQGSSRGTRSPARSR